MTCTHALECICTRCKQVRRHAYREGLADAHRVYCRSQPTLAGPRISARVMADLLPALNELEWSGAAICQHGQGTEAGCPECGAPFRLQVHEPDCELAEAIAQARVALVQPDLFAVR